MRLSLIIPAHNEQRHLDRSLATLLRQRDQFGECIVVDDGSDPPLTLPDWVTPVRVRRRPGHRGSSFAKNLGASYSTGDYLCFCDSDILHLPDAFASLRSTMQAWIDEGEPDVLLNVARYSLRADADTTNLEALWYEGQDTKEGRTAVCWEQNCGLIRRDLFESLGGYDEKSFPSWGFNNHDLCLRLAAAGGRVSSYIPRVAANGRLMCFHQWHENNVDIEQAKKEFIAKWGEEWHHTLYEKVARGAHERRAVQTAN